MKKILFLISFIALAFTANAQVDLLDSIQNDNRYIPGSPVAGYQQTWEDSRIIGMWTDSTTMSNAYTAAVAGVGAMARTYVDVAIWISDGTDWIRIAGTGGSGSGHSGTVEADGFILTENTTDNKVTISSVAGGNSAFFGVGNGTQRGISLLNITSTNNAIIAVNDTIVTLARDQGTGSQLGQVYIQREAEHEWQTGYQIGLGGEIKYLATFDTTGLFQYGGDYSAKFTDRSFVDKGYVDGLGGLSAPVLNSEHATMQAYSFKVNLTAGAAIPGDGDVGDFSVQNSIGLGDWFPFWENSGELRKGNISAIPMQPPTVGETGATLTLTDADVDDQFGWSIINLAPGTPMAITVGVGIGNDYLDIQLTTNEVITWAAAGVSLTGSTTDMQQWDWVRVRWNSPTVVDISLLSEGPGGSGGHAGIVEANDFDLRATNVNETLQFQAIEGNITQYLSMKNGVADGISMTSVNAATSSTASVEADTDGDPDVFIYAGEDVQSMSMIKLDSIEVVLIAGYGPDFGDPAAWDLGKFVFLDKAGGLQAGSMTYEADYNDSSFVTKSYVDSNLSSSVDSVHSYGTTSHTTVLGNQFMHFTNASPVQVTIAPNADVPYPVGWKLSFYQDGDGRLEILEGVGVSFGNSISNSDGDYKALGKGYMVEAEKVGTDAWLLSRDLEGENGHGAWIVVSFMTDWGNLSGQTAKWRNVVINGEPWIQYNGSMIEYTGTAIASSSFQDFTGTHDFTHGNYYPVNENTATDSQVYLISPVPADEEMAIRTQNASETFASIARFALPTYYIPISLP